MSKRKVIIVTALSIVLAGASWIYAQAKLQITAQDYSQIQELYANYAQSLDLNRPENLAGVFTDDGELISSGGQPFKGRDALYQMEVSHDNSGTRHITANLAITQTADGVRATCYLINVNVRTAPSTLTFTGLFDATVVKTAAGWKFKKLRVWRDGDPMNPFKATSVQGQGKKK